jgi:hypothetical protein
MFDATRVMAAVVMLSAAFAEGGMQDKLARFSTPGPDCYADGTIVRDGECYALVWSPAGTAFAGFNADGTPVSPNDRVVLAGELAQDGRCLDVNFQIPAADYEELQGGEWAVCLVDTRMVNGVPAGVRDGKPLRVNRWGAVKGGVKIDPVDVTGQQAGGTRRLASTGGTGSAASYQTVRASTLSAIPPGLMPPTITAIEVQDGEVWLGVVDTVPYLSYTIVSGETPTDLKTDRGAQVVDGENGAEIAIGTIQSPTRRFFKVKRAE